MNVHEKSAANGYNRGVGHGKCGFLPPEYRFGRRKFAMELINNLEGINILYEAKPEVGERFLYVGFISERNGYSEIRVLSSENIVELYLNGELRHKQKSINGEFVFCTPLSDFAEAGKLAVLAKTMGDDPLSDEVTVNI